MRFEGELSSIVLATFTLRLHDVPIHLLTALQGASQSRA
jgi:hypothetical protein